MTIKKLRRAVLVVAMATTGLAACSNDGGEDANDEGPTTTSLSAFVAALIGTQTCDNAQPTPINGVELVADEVPIDVDALVPGDSGCPPT